MQANLRPFQNFAFLSGSYPKVIWISSAQFFFLLTSYFLLRPLRDEIAMTLGTKRLPWLFTGSTAAMFFVILVIGLRGRGLGFRLPTFVYCLAMAVQFMFYIAHAFIHSNIMVSSVFFVWIGVYNLLIISVFWSSVSPVIEKSSALRLYALIAAGGTLGALVGPLLATLLSRCFHSSSLLLTSIICLGVAFTIQIATGRKGSETKINANQLHHEHRTCYFPDLKSILLSPKLLSIASFMALYICMSGFIYFQQSVSLPKYLVSTNERIQYFARLDLTVNFLVLMVQLFLTSRIYRWFAPKQVLVAAPLLVGCTFLFLHIGSYFFLISLASIVHRVIHFSLLVPARESAYTEINTDNFYSSKTTIDTLLYRGSDALFGWGLSVLFAFSLTSLQLMAVGLTISIVWSVSGYYLGKKFNVFQNSTT